ncbi:COG2426 family protein [Clostridium tepidiprofundi]|nr:small multi-drug export protein [Clostridium tepidiprofundi]
MGIIKSILIVIFWSAVPIVEQRGAIPIGLFRYNLNPFVVFVVSYLGSLLPVPFILLLFEKIFEWLKKYKIFYKFCDIIERKINKNKYKFEKYKEPALITFIAIPLPTTGVWTGTAIAAFLKFDFKKSVLCAAIGALISSAVITIGLVAVPAMLGY